MPKPRDGVHREHLQHSRSRIGAQVAAELKATLTHHVEGRIRIDLVDADLARDRIDVELGRHRVERAQRGDARGRDAVPGSGQVVDGARTREHGRRPRRRPDRGRATRGHELVAAGRAIAGRLWCSPSALGRIGAIGLRSFACSRIVDEPGPLRERAPGCRARSRPR